MRLNSAVTGRKIALTRLILQVIGRYKLAPHLLYFENTEYSEILGALFMG